MAAVRQDIVIEQGATFTMTLTLVDAAGVAMDVTGWSACSQIRQVYSTNTVSANLGTSLANGSLVLSINAASTANLEPGRYVYDATMNLASNAYGVRLVSGLATVSPGVSR